MLYSYITENAHFTCLHYHLHQNVIRILSQRSTSLFSSPPFIQRCQDSCPSNCRGFVELRQFAFFPRSTLLGLKNSTHTNCLFFAHTQTDRFSLTTFFYFSWCTNRLHEESLFSSFVRSLMSNGLCITCQNKLTQSKSFQVSEMFSTENLAINL